MVRASASRAIARCTSPSIITSPAARSSVAILRITIDACSRGRRNGAAGTTVAATSATSPPTTASVQRVNAAPGSGTSEATTIDCTAAWVTKSCPPSSRNADDIASATISAICQPPDPSPATSRSARNTPTATPTVTSATRRSRWP